jgi:predicted unusual protein kinase regulating ubiquinone biosynthesis (AarF/ABC1/UbiB family)
VGLKELSSSIHIPRDWVLLERTLLLLTGVCTNLDPNLNPMQLIRPYLEQFVLGNRDWTQIAIEAVRDTALKAIALPEKLDRYVQKAIRGELEIRVRGLRDGVETMYAIGRQAMYLAVATVLGITAIYAHAQWHDDRLARMLGYSAILPAVLFLVFSIVDRPSRRR